MSFFFSRKPQCSLRQSRGEFKGRRETRLTFCTQHAHFLSGYSLYVLSFMLQVFNSLETSLDVKNKKNLKKLKKIKKPFKQGHATLRSHYHFGYLEVITLAPELTIIEIQPVTFN